MATPSTQNNTDATVDTIVTMLGNAATEMRTVAAAMTAGTYATGGKCNTGQITQLKDAAERLVAIVAHSASDTAANIADAIKTDAGTRLTALTTRKGNKANELASAEEAAGFTATVDTNDSTL